jgi:hypothetical protein
MGTTTAKNREPTNVLSRIKRGLSAYVSYLAACEMNQAFSEYALYEPILRILMARGYTVKCEYKCPGIQQPALGDKKRLDFYAVRKDFYAVRKPLRLAIEVKWVKSKKPDIKSDVEKLQAFLAVKPASIALLCVFGRKSKLKALKLSTGRFKERGEAVYADLRKTRYGCRIYQLQPPKKRLK